MPNPSPSATSNPNLVAVLPAATDLNRFTDTMVGFYVENKTQWAEKFRSVLALRGDEAIYNVTNLTPTYVATELPGAPVINFAELNSGTASKFLPSPKASLIFGPWANTEFYIQGGFSFHSNDARGATQRVEPISPDYPFPTPSTPISPPGPNQRRGSRRAHCGRPTSAKYPFALVSIQCFRTAAGWRYRRHGCFNIAEQSLWRRMGELLHASWNIWLLILTLRTPRPFLPTIDPDDAAPGSPGGKWVPEAVGLVISSGVTVQNYKSFWGSLRLRAFGPRNLTSDAIYRSSSTVLLNAEVGYHINEKWRVSAQLFNLLNRYDHDIDYAYTSRITPTGAAAFTDVFHPVEPFQVRFTLVRTFGRK